MAEQNSTKRAHNFKDLTGQRFGRLIAVSFSGIHASGYAEWSCLCDCGQIAIAISSNLIRGVTSSCGCYQLELARASLTTHGGSHTREYRSWAGAKERCLNPNAKAYKNYGGRGITMCDEWRDSFPQFLEDMGLCPKGLSLDRENNELGYSRDNCRWTDRATQTRNRRYSVLVTHDGLTMTLKEWSARTGIPYRRLWKRRKAGLPLFAPPFRRRSVKS